MDIAVVRERGADDRRVALTPPVVRRLVNAGNRVWMETRAGEGAMFADSDYSRAGAEVVYSASEAIQRAGLVAKISRPTSEELSFCNPGTALMAFYHMAVAGRGMLETLADREVTAIGCEIIQTDTGWLPVLAPISEIAGRMTIPIAAHLLRSSSGGRGILLGGTPGEPPARVLIVGAGSVGFAAARSAAAAGARVMIFDVEPAKLRRALEHLNGVDTCLADEDALAAALREADVVIGAVLVAGTRAPRVITVPMVESMKPGSAVLDVSIDQGGCVETSRPTTIGEPTFSCRGVTHFCVPNFTADLGRASSVAIAQAMLPYLLEIAGKGVAAALETNADLARGVYTLRGKRP